MVDTDTTNAANGRARAGSGEGSWTAAIVPPPNALAGGRVVDVAHAFGPVTVTDGRPSYAIAAQQRTAGRPRILIGNTDVTYLRGVAVPFPGFSLIEPLMYGTTDIRLPQVSALFERPGTGALRWCRPWSTVEIQRVDPDTGAIIATDYRGIIVGYDVGDAGSLVLNVAGEAVGPAAMQDRQPPIFTGKSDLGRHAWEAMQRLSLRLLPDYGPETGIVVPTFGGGGTALDHIQQIIAMSWNRTGNRWTIMPTGRGRYEMTRKDRTTIHGTVYADDTRTVVSLARDLTEEPNRVYVTGVTPGGQRVRFGQYPGLKQTPTPPYPFADGRTFGQGTTDAETRNGDGITLLTGRLRVTRYLDADDLTDAGRYTFPVTRAVRDLQRDAGLPVTGNVNRDTWAVAYDLGVTGYSLRWSSIQPAAERSVVRRWNKSPSGARIKRNPGYNPDIPKVDRTVDVGAGFTRDQMRDWAEAELDDATAANWAGTLTFNTGALVSGSHAPGAAFPQDRLMPARDLRPGMNLRLPLFDDGITVHVAAVTVSADGIVSADVDTRARDAEEVWAVIARRREARRSPHREWLRQHRQSEQTKDALTGWDEVGGILEGGLSLPANGWRVVPIVAGQEGSIRSLRLRVSPATEFHVSIFAREVKASRLGAAIGNPLSEEGTRRWKSEAVTDGLARDRVLLYAAGDFEKPCGYYPKEKGGEDDSGVVEAALPTGRWQDDAGFSYYTGSQPVIYLAVYAAAECRLQAGRIMWPQLEGGV